MAITFVHKTWTDSIVDRLSKDVSVKVSTKTIHPISGEETLSDGEANTVSMVFYKSAQSWTFDKEGQVEGGDAFIVTKTGDYKKDDKIKINNEVFRISNLIAYYSDNANAVKLFTYYNLFKVE